jgi:hypothetical protein
MQVVYRLAIAEPNTFPWTAHKLFFARSRHASRSESIRLLTVGYCTKLICTESNVHDGLLVALHACCDYRL